MTETLPNRTVGVTVIAVLALAQGLLGVLRALRWFEVGSDLLGQGLLLVPLVGIVAYVRGALIIVIALLYIAFAFGLFSGRAWARSLGLAVATVNLLLVVSVLIQGEFFARDLLWLIVPVMVVCYLLSPGGRPKKV